MTKSTSDMYFDDLYMLDIFTILLENIGKISFRFFFPSWSLSKIKYNCLKVG